MTVPRAVDDRIEREEEMVLERLEAIRELRKETRRIENEGHPGVACDVLIPAGWLELLGRGLQMVVAQAKRRHADGELSDDERREQVEQADRLAGAIRDVEPGEAYCVSSDHYAGLLMGLGQAADIQDFQGAGLSKYDPFGQRFIANHSYDALSQLLWLLHKRME